MITIAVYALGRAKVPGENRNAKRGVDHQDGFKSVYMHLSGFSVSNGTIVSAGQQIGLTGATGIATGDHLQFGISYNGVYVNPCLYVNL